MTIEQQKENSPKFREIEWVSNQVKEELKRFNKEKFYEKDGDEIVYNMDTVKDYLGVLKNKKTWKDLISRNSSVMVMAVQIALYSQDYSFGSIDGILGNETKAAIKKFQADNNLSVDPYGRSLPSTIEKLLEVISKEYKIEIPEEEQEEAQEIVGERSENKGQESDKGLQQDKGVDIPNSGQNNIRPEVEELLKHNGSFSGFEKLTTLTKNEADAIFEKLGSHDLNILDLSGITNIDADTFEVLLKFKRIKIGLENLTPELAKKLEGNESYISFSGLENINKFEVYQSLGRTKGTLKFEKLKDIKPEEMGELVKKTSGDIYLNAIKNIDGIASSLLEYSGTISFDGVNKISKEALKILLNKEQGTINLGLESLDDEILGEFIDKLPSQHLKFGRGFITQIGYYKKQKEIEGKNISEKILSIVKEKKYVELSELDNITYDEIEYLNNNLGSINLNLSGVKNITLENFGKLLEHKGGIDIGIKNLTTEFVEKLVESGRGIIFSGLETISPEVYQILGKTKGTLEFKALKSISAVDMGELANKKENGYAQCGNICLNSIGEITPEIAEKILDYPMDIMMNGIKNIDKETAEVLSSKTGGRIYLEGLEAVIDTNTVDKNSIYKQLENLNKEQLENIEALSKIPNLQTNVGILLEIKYYKLRKKESEEQ